MSRRSTIDTIQVLDKLILGWEAILPRHEAASFTRSAITILFWQRAFHPILYLRIRLECTRVNRLIFMWFSGDGSSCAIPR